MAKHVALSASRPLGLIILTCKSMGSVGFQTVAGVTY